MDRKWLFGGLCIAAGVGFVLYRLSDDGKATNEVKLTKNQLVSILIDLREEVAQGLKLLAAMAIAMKERGFDDKSIEEVLMASTSSRNDRNQAKITVCSKHKVTLEQVESSLISFQYDPTITQLLSDLDSDQANAYRGIAPKSEFGLPSLYGAEGMPGDPTSRQAISGEFGSPYSTQRNQGRGTGVQMDLIRESS